jgi:hypothetical protein
MDKACSTHGGKRNAYRFRRSSQKERDHYEHLDMGGRVILKWISGRMGWYGLD